MNLICLFKARKNTYKGFFVPAWAGNHVVEATLTIDDDDVCDYTIPIFDSYNEAYKFANLTQMSEENYNKLYDI